MGATSIANSTFQDNHIQPALVKEYGILTSYDGAPVKYQNVTFENNDGHYILFNVTNGADGIKEKQVFFGSPSMRVGLTGGEYITSSPVSQAPNDFLSLNDERLMRIRKVRY